MSDIYPFSLRIAPVDKEDLSFLVNAGVYTNLADAGRGVMRRGIEQVKKERGI